MIENRCCGNEEKPLKRANISYGCGCVGYGYVPVQEIDQVYDVDKALMCGTVFPELILTMNEYGCICKSEGGVSDE